MSTIIFLHFACSDVYLWVVAYFKFITILVYYYIACFYVYKLHFARVQKEASGQKGHGTKYQNYIVIAFTGSFLEMLIHLILSI